MIISIIHIMKGILYLGAAVAVLRSAAAFLPNNNNHHDIHDQLVFQPSKGADKAVDTSAASREAIDAKISAPRFGADVPLVQDVGSPGSEHAQSLDDIDQPPQNPNFPIGTTTSQWAITYTPYTDSLTCLAASTIRSDVAAIARKGFTTVRLYSIDCSILQHMEPALLTYNLKLIVGIALDSGLDSASTQISELIAWANPSPNETNKWPLIELIVIGSDAIFSSRITPNLLATLLTTTRLTLRSHSYAGPLTTTEPLSILTTYAHLLCPTLDIPAATIHPFFHPLITASDAGTYVSTQLTHLSTLCPNLKRETSIALETGWPSRGVANGAAVPGYVEQWVAVSGIVDSGVGGRSVFLGWGDEGWREGGEFGVEGSWGCGHVFGGEGE